MCERINLSVWVESIVYRHIYVHIHDILPVQIRYIICAYTWHCTGSYHSSHIQNLLKQSTTSEQLLSLRWLVGRACVSLLNMLDFGFPFLQLETDSSYRSHTFQECIHVTMSFNKCFFSIEATFPTQLEPGLHVAKVSLWSCSFHQHHQHSYGFESFSSQKVCRAPLLLLWPGQSACPKS